MIESYLDELFDRLTGSGQAGRRALAEAEDHLREAAQDEQRAGLDLDAAERAAVARFGPVPQFAAQLRNVHNGPAAVLRHAFVGAWLIAGVGLVAIGLSGVLAEILSRVFGAMFVAGDTLGVTYTPDRCADFGEYHPETTTCAAAAAAHHFDEVIGYRLDVGVLGVLALVTLGLARRYTRLGQARWSPPRGTVLAVVVSMFALAAAATVGPPLMAVAFGAGTNGLGANLSAGTIAAAVSLVSTTLALRHHRTDPARAR